MTARAHPCLPATVVFAAQMCYNGVHMKANGAGVQPPRAALSSHDGGIPS